jgi:hypothetical protein
MIQTLDPKKVKTPSKKEAERSTSNDLNALKTVE